MPTVGSIPLGEDTIFDLFIAKQADLSIYNRQTGKEKIITRVFGEFPHLFWSKDSKELLVTENYYTQTKKSAFCKVSRYSVDNEEYRLLCRLQQLNVSDDANFQPSFYPIAIANGRYLLSQVATAIEAKQVIYRVICVDVNNPVRHDILQFKMPKGFRGYFPFVAWVDEPSA